MNHRSPEIEVENNPYNGGGRNILMYIGIDAYTQWSRLNNAVLDATTLKEVLVGKYQFREEHCLPFLNEQATRQQILDQLDYFCTKGSDWFLGEDDNLILYYSGHGTISGTRGFWAPIDGSKSTSTMISNSDVHDRLKDIQARHIYLIVDSCYAGSFVRRSEENTQTQFVENMLRLPSRRVLASGRAGEQVSDGLKGKHSPFANSLLTYLKTYAEGPLVAKQLELHVEKTTPMTYAGQQPISAYLYELNHQDGQFVFFPRQDDEESFWKKVRERHEAKMYREYLGLFPTGKYASQAREELDLMDAAAWKLAKRADSAAEYWEYLRDFPEGRYLSQARQALLVLDETAWKQADRSKNYAAYLAEFPQGRHAERALRLQAETPTIIDSQPKPTPAILRIFPDDPYSELVLVQGGVFQMGSEEDDREKPVHTVQVGDFYLGKYPVTVGLFKHFIDESAYRTDAEKGGRSYFWNGKEWVLKKGVYWIHDSFGNKRVSNQYDHPVVHLSWNDAKAFCEWLTKKHKKTYRLPSESEWEYAARGGRMSKGYAYAGSNEIEEVAWYWQNSGDKRLDGDWDGQKIGKNNCRTQPVGRKKPNEQGLCDMSGNVWEWFEDDWHDNYQGAPGDGSAWIDRPDRGASRVLRGGSWDDGARLCRVSTRSNYTPVNRFNSNGFRLALPPSSVS